jgi:hypothetical protein
MMRRTPLARRTPLQARKPLTATAPLRRTAALKPGTAQRAQAAAAGRGRSTSGTQPFGQMVCGLIDARDSDHDDALPMRLCQRCGSARNLQRHHRRAKAKGGSAARPHTQCCCNGILLCGPYRSSAGCHAWAHAHPEEARAEGWIVSQSVDEPGSVGVMRFAAAEDGATQWPTCSGEWAQAAPEAREAA